MTATTIRVQMAQRKDTAANWTAANPILLSGEIGYETDTKKFKIGDGSTNWNSLAYLPIPDGSGNLTITGNLEIGTTGSLTFEGSTADGFETTLAVTNPTADRTITLPDRSGTVITSGDTGTVTSTMLADGTIVNADISGTAEIAVSKLANGTANQVLVTDGTDVSWSDNLTLAGNLTVNGTTTTIDTTTLLVEDKNIEMGVVATPTDVTADGGGITLRGTTNKTINWIDSTDSWTSSEHVDLASGKSYRINGTEVLSSSTLGSGVTGSSLTSVGTIGTGVWQGTAISKTYLDATLVSTGDTGTVTSTMIADGTIVNADVNASAAIAGTKISPDFGSQNVVTTGTSTAASFIPTSSTAPTNGVYLPAANSVAISTNGQGRLFVDASGNVGVGTNSLGNALVVYRGAGSSAYSEYVGNNSPAGSLLVGQDSTGLSRIFQSGANPVTVWTNGSERLRITSTGQLSHIGAGTSGSPAVSFSGSANQNSLVVASNSRVGVGTSSPGALLSLAGSSAYTVGNSGLATAGLDVNATAGGSGLFGGAISFGAGGTGRASISSVQGTADSDVVGLVFNVHNSGSAAADAVEAMRIDGSTGRVGIGTNSPSYALSIKGGSSTSQNLLLTWDTNQTDAYARIRSQFAEGNTSCASEIRFHQRAANLDGGYQTFWTTNAAGSLLERMRIDPSGNVGIGTVSPDSKISIGGTGANRISFSGSTGQQYVGFDASEDVLQVASNTAIKFQTGSSYTERARIDSSGTVNIKGAGTAGVTQAVSFSGSAPVNSLVIDSSGRLGIGISSPTALLHVNGDSRFVGPIRSNTIISNVDIANSSYDGISFSVAAEETTPTGLFFSPDGRKMFVTGTVGDDINEYTLSTPWTCSTATYVTAFSVAGQEINPQDLYFRNDGKKLYVIGSTSRTVYQYSLSTPWSIASASYDSISFSVATQETVPTSLTFKRDGLAFYIVGTTSDTVYRYNLSTAWNVSTATFANSFSVAAQELTPQSVTFTDDGSRMFVLGSTGDDISIYNLTTPWDITTASFATVFSTVAQDNAPTGLFVKPDGSKFYIAGSTNDTVYQYSIPSVTIDLTGTSNINGCAEIAQDLKVRGGVGFYGTEPVAQPAAIANITTTATSGSLPTPDGTVTIANATTPTVTELLEYCVELESKLEAALAHLRTLGLIAT